MTTEKLVKTPQGRVRRNPLASRNRLKVKGNLDPNFVYRVVNDTEDRIQELMDIGYVPELADDVHVNGDSIIDDPKKLGKAKQVSVGQGTKAILMKIPKEYFNEDQEAKEAYLKKVEEAMKRSNPNEGTYGKVDISPLK